MKTTLDNTQAVYQIIYRDQSTFCNSGAIADTCKQLGIKSLLDGEAKLLRIWNHKFEAVKGDHLKNFNNLIK